MTEEGGSKENAWIARRALQRLALPSPRRSLRALRNASYRRWAAGALVSNIGTWMQRTAQDWLVFVELTPGSAASLGVVSALQFAPQLMFLPWSGPVADRFDRRRIVFMTQIAMGVCSLLLALLTITGAVRLWHVWIIAFVSGTAAAFDTPARQTFVSDLVGDDDLDNAVALNSTSFNLARVAGPALAGACIDAVGSGWAILLNGLSFFGVMASLLGVVPSGTIERHRVKLDSFKEFRAGINYAWGRDDLKTIMAMLILFGAFGLNFPLYLTTMSLNVFGVGAARFGLLMSILAIGSTIGALLATGRQRPTMVAMTSAAALFGTTLIAAAVMPSFWLFGLLLVPIGMASQAVANVSSSLCQLATVPRLRGRVIAIRMSVLTGFSFLGAPALGLIADHVGPRWSLVAGGAAGMAAGGIGWAHLLRVRHVQAGSSA